MDVTGLSLSGTDAGNYTIATPAIATASITPAPLTVTANPATMVYGGKVPTLTDTATGLVGRDTVATALTGSLATTATSKSSVGDYPITQGTLTAVNGDYTITFTGSTLSVTPAPLTITANDVSTVYGAPLPALTASYSGFVNNDTAASLTTPPSLTTPATATSPVGTYPISVSGASSSDYTITYVPGTITIAKAGTSVGVSESLSTSVVGQGVTFTVQVAPISPSTGHPTGTVTFFADGNPVATAAVNPATGQASFSTTSLGLGSHTITADYSGDSNYTSSQSGPTAETVSAAATETVLTTTAVRNKRGRIVKVMIGSQVIAISPGAGTPTGVVTYYRGVHPIASMALSDGSAVQHAQEHSRVEEAVHRPIQRRRQLRRQHVADGGRHQEVPGDVGASVRPRSSRDAERRSRDAIGAAYGVARVTGNVRSSAAPASGRPGSGGIPTSTARAATKSGRGEASQSIQRSTRGEGFAGVNRDVRTDVPNPVSCRADRPEIPTPNPLSTASLRVQPRRNAAAAVRPRRSRRTRPVRPG